MKCADYGLNWNTPSIYNYQGDGDDDDCARFWYIGKLGADQTPWHQTQASMLFYQILNGTKIQNIKHELIQIKFYKYSLFNKSQIKQNRKARQPNKTIKNLIPACWNFIGDDITQALLPCIITALFLSKASPPSLF